MSRQHIFQRGFTMVEAVIVIAVTGVIAAIVSVFIVSPIKGYQSTVLHAQMTDAADVALRRMEREIRRALPNSLRLTNDLNGGTCASGSTCYIEFIPTYGGALYRAPGDGSTGGKFLDFTNNTATPIFDMLGLVPSPAPAVGTSGDYIVIYNLGPGFEPANAYQLNVSGQCATANQGCNIAQISSISGNTITLASNPFANQSPPLPSPNNRFEFVPNTGPVSYSCSLAAAGAPMYRYTNYGGFTTTGNQSIPTSGNGNQLLNNATCSVDYNTNALLRNGILFVQINVVDASTKDTVKLFREIHVDNAP